MRATASWYSVDPHENWPRYSVVEGILIYFKTNFVPAVIWLSKLIGLSHFLAMVFGLNGKSFNLIWKMQCIMNESINEVNCSLQGIFKWRKCV